MNKFELLKLLEDEDVKQVIKSIMKKQKVKSKVNPIVKEVSEGILDYFNWKMDKKIGTGLNDIIARLNSKISPSKLVGVINMKYDEWYDNDVMKKYIHPSTLFRKSNTEKYVEEDKLSEFTPARHNIIEILRTKDRELYSSLDVGMSSEFDYEDIDNV